MSPICPTHQGLWSYFSMETSSMDPNLGATAPYGTIQSVWRWVRSCHSSIPCLGHQNATHWKNRERDRILALGGHGLNIKHNSQLIVGIHGGRDIIDETQLGRNMWGGVPYHRLGLQTKQQNKLQKEIGRGLRRVPNNIYTQQPTKNTRSQWKRNRRGDSTGKRSAGEEQYNCFWDNQVGRG